MASFSYNTDDFPQLPSNECFHQLTSIYIPVKARERNSKAVSFSYMVNPLLLEKKGFVLLKRICFRFNQMVFSGLILGHLFYHVNLLFVQHLVYRMYIRLLSLLSLYVTVKTSAIVLKVVILSVRVVDRVNKPEYPIVSSSNSVTNISKSPKFTPTNSHSIDSSTSTIRVVSHRNIHRKRKLRKSVISSSFVNSANSHDIANKFIVGRDRINVLANP